MKAVEVVGVSRTFRGRPPIQALSDVSLSVDAGEILGLLGANGAGKTTLIKIVSTLLLPTAGAVSILGRDTRTDPRGARAMLSVVFGGDRGLYERLSALDNLTFFSVLHGERTNVERRALAALEQVGLGERARSRVETFSKGMRQRLHLASGLVVNAPVLLLDEPTIGLDITEAARIREVVRAIADRGAAVILTSHYPVDIDTLADRIVLLQSGKVTHDLPAADFRRQTGFVAEAVVQGTGLAPDHLDPEAIETLEDGWRVRLRIPEWNESGLKVMTDVLSSSNVVDVRVVPVGVDAVLSAIARGAAT